MTVTDGAPNLRDRSITSDAAMDRIRALLKQKRDVQPLLPLQHVRV